MARPTKLTAAASDTICAAVENGAAFETACEAAGIAAGTGWEWLARGMGRDSERPATAEFAKFAERIEVAGAPDAPVKIQHKRGLNLGDVFEIARECGGATDEDLDRLRAIKPAGT